VNGSGKHSSLLPYVKHYSCKQFLGQIPGLPSSNLVKAKIVEVSFQDGFISWTPASYKVSLSSINTDIICGKNAVEK
jgi:hypothetical protein